MDKLIWHTGESYQPIAEDQIAVQPEAGTLVELEDIYYIDEEEMQEVTETKWAIVENVHPSPHYKDEVELHLFDGDRRYEVPFSTDPDACLDETCKPLALSRQQAEARGLSLLQVLAMLPGVKVGSGERGDYDLMLMLEHSMVAFFYFESKLTYNVLKRKDKPLAARTYEARARDLQREGALRAWLASQWEVK